MDDDDCIGPAKNKHPPILCIYTTLWAISWCCPAQIVCSSNPFSSIPWNSTRIITASLPTNYVFARATPYTRCCSFQRSLCPGCEYNTVRAPIRRTLLPNIPRLYYLRRYCFSPRYLVDMSLIIRVTVSSYQRNIWIFHNRCSSTINKMCNCRFNENINYYSVNLIVNISCFEILFF